MQSATESQTALSIERKLKMHEARESIIDRLAANLPTETKEAPKQAPPEPGALKG